MQRARNIVELTHLLLKDYLNKDTVAIDMTLGNGNDTLFLAKHIKYVYAYEIQTQGILNSKTLLKKENITNYQIFNESHVNVKALDSKYDVVIFNLGYLPGSDKTITTTYDSTLTALEIVLKNESTKVVALVVYPGHAEGQTEAYHINNYINSLDNTYKITKVSTISKNNKAPYLLMFERNKNE